MVVEDPDSQDLRIGRILNEYLDRKQRGEPVCEQDLLDAHPDLADELRSHFGMVRQIPVLSPAGWDDRQTVALPQGALPGYEILGEIHRGGQGVVYQAVQKATRRKVAIKVMREGPFAGWRDRARFEREVQVLGALKHPSIVAIHDSGAAAGCDFFVMDYITGSPLEAWLSASPRSVEHILKLFVTICDAVNAAHIKGIIHRDLKPGNIRIDDEGRPHILDFGLAKTAADDEPESKTAHMTVVGQFVGSLPWTSPEQAQGMLDQIDTRTDVYALGVVLYYMLTGKFPYDVVGPMRDVLNRIVSDEPVRPSTIRAGLPHDVEAIDLKCLRKEPARRYQTAGELGRDIERYLHGEPVAARSDSGLYVLRKTLRRHRIPVAVVTAFVILVSVSLLGSISLWRQAVAERDRAVAAERDQKWERSRADAQAAEADQAREAAELERARAQEQAERLRRTMYLNQIALAQNAWEQKYLTQVQHRLEGCPSDLRGWEWYYLSRVSRRSALLDIRADSECVVAAAISSDGARIATGGCDGVIRIWNAVTGAAVTELKGHAGQVNALAFSPDPDGRWIASGGRDKTLRLWDPRTGSQRILEEGQQYIYCLAFSPDATCVVAGGQSRMLTFRDVASGRVIRATSGHDAEVSCVAYSPDGERVAAGEFRGPSGGGSKVRIWDAATAQQIREWAGHAAGVLSVAFSPDGKYLASGGGIPATSRDALGTLIVSDSSTGEEILSLRGHGGFVESLAFSPAGGVLASAGASRMPPFGMESDRTVKIWDAVTGEEVCTYSAHHGGGRTVVWSPEGNRVFSGGMDGRLKAWPSTVPPEARVLRGHSGPVLRIVFSPDGKRMASSGGQGDSFLPETGAPDNAVRVWDAKTGTQLLVLDQHKNAVLGLAWSPDGRYLASGGADHTIRVWDGTTGARQLLLENWEGIIQGVAFSPDSSLLAGVAGSTAMLWTVSDGTEYRRLPHDDTLVTVTFSPDGRWLATGGQRGMLRIWDRHSDNEYRSISAGPDLTGAWFSPDSTTIATAHINGSIFLWDVSTGSQSAAMSGPQRSVQWLDFSPDGHRIASCTTDMMLKIWDVYSASEVYAVRAHDAPVTCVRFSPDGRTIATCGQDGLIKLWEAQPEPTSLSASTGSGQ